MGEGLERKRNVITCVSTVKYDFNTITQLLKGEYVIKNLNSISFYIRKERNRLALYIFFLVVLYFL